jgi:hypothetical protein
VIFEGGGGGLVRRMAGKVVVVVGDCIISFSFFCDEREVGLESVLDD